MVHGERVHIKEIRALRDYDFDSRSRYGNGRRVLSTVSGCSGHCPTENPPSRFSRNPETWVGAMNGLKRRTLFWVFWGLTTPYISFPLNGSANRSTT